MDHSVAVELFLWVAPSFLTRCHTDHSLAGLPAHPCSQFTFCQNAHGLLWLQLQRENRLKARELRSHRVGVCAHLHGRNPALEPPHCLLFRVWEQFPVWFSFLIPNGRWASRPCSSYRCRKGNPLQGPRVGSHVLTKQETWLEGRPGGQQQGEEAPGDLCNTWPAVSGFMVMGLVSRLSLAKHSDSGFVSCILFSFLITSYYCWGSPDTLYLFGSRNHVLF